jgi:hypothetical protein
MSYYLAQEDVKLNMITKLQQTNHCKKQKGRSPGAGPALWARLSLKRNVSQMLERSLLVQDL